MSEWDEHAADWDADAGPRVYAEAAFGSLLTVLEHHGVDLERASVCDFGCGTGLLIERMVERTATVDAVDSSPAMLDVLRAKVDRNGWTGVRTFVDLDEASGPYDVVVCSSVLSFVDDHPGTVGRLVSMLRPGGALVQWDWERAIDAEDDHGLTPGEIGSALESAGLVDVEVRPAFEVEVDDLVMRPLLGHGRRPQQT